MEKGKSFGSGFAVSDKLVYTVAHHWEEVSGDGRISFAVEVGSQVECIHGKPSANRKVSLEVVKLDKHLDYCILELMGGITFPTSGWLELDPCAQLRLTTPVFLASFQIGIQEHLDDYGMGVSLGITNGIVVRKSQRHMLHSCAAFKGDSGGAIVISNGKVVGLHVAAVNEARELMDMNSVDFESVADSINNLCDAQSSGSVALLASAIAKL